MKRSRTPSGQSLVEFAIIFPLVFFLITGFLDLGRVVYNYAVMSNAVREGARYATVHGDDLDLALANPADNPIIDVVLDYAVGVKLSKSDITVLVTENEDENKEKISITATLLFKPITPGIKRIFGGKAGIPLSAQSTMRIAPASR